MFLHTSATGDQLSCSQSFSHKTKISNTPLKLFVGVSENDVELQIFGQAESIYHREYVT